MPNGRRGHPPAVETLTMLCTPGKGRGALALVLLFAMSCTGTETGTEVEDTDPIASVTSATTVADRTVGDTVTVSFTVLGASGAALPGESVTFSATGGGSVSPAAATTDGTGSVATLWTLGTTAASQSVTASAGGRTGTVTTTPMADAPSQLTASSGSGQSGAPGTMLSSPLVATATDPFGNPVQGVTVTFTAETGGGSVDPSTDVTRADGTASTTWTLGQALGSQTVRADANGLTAATFTATASVSAFDMEIRIVGTVPADVQAALDSAEARWEEIITGDLADMDVQVPARFCENGHPPVNETVDDVLIFVEITSIDGPDNTLAAAGGCVARATAPTVSALGSMDLDSADLDLMRQEGTLGTTVLHELAHVLGVGNDWEALGYLQGKGTADPTYTGQLGVEQYKVLGGPRDSIPVENTGGEGTADSHWRTSVFKTELMVGFAEPGVNPLSVITIGALLDLGYVADLDKADAYNLPVVTQVAPPTGRRRWELLRSPKALVTEDGSIRIIG